MSTRQILITQTDRARLEKTFGLLAGQSHEEWHSIRRLENELSGATVLDSKEIAPDIVTMNSTVLLRDLDAGGDHVCTLVYPSYSALAEDKVSVLLPLGTALLGSRIGETITCSVADRARRFEIVDVLYQPEASGHYFL